MRRAVVVVLTLGLFLGVAPAPSQAAQYPTFHPRQNVAAKQLGPHKMRFVNKTKSCQALTLTYRNGSSETARLRYTRETQRLLIGGTVKSVRVYRPGC